MLFYLQDQLPHLGCDSQLEAAVGNRPSGVFSMTASWLSLWPSLSPTLNYRKHLHILFHNTHLLPIRLHDILLLIYTGASLMAWSRFKYTYEFKLLRHNYIIFLTNTLGKGMNTFIPFALG